MSDSTEAQIVQPALFDELPDQAPPLYLYADEHVFDCCVDYIEINGSERQE